MTRARCAVALVFAAACGAPGKPRPNDRICPPVARCVADPAPAPAAPPAPAPVDAGTPATADAVSAASLHTDDAVGAVREIVRLATQRRAATDMVASLGTVVRQTAGEIVIQPSNQAFREVRVATAPDVTSIELTFGQPQWLRELQGAFGPAKVSPTSHPFDDEERVYEIDVDWGESFSIRLETSPVAIGVAPQRAGVTAVTLYRTPR